MRIYELIKMVQEKHRGICTRLEERTRTAKQTWQAHGVEPVTMNALSYGKPSPADHYADFVQEYEAAKPGAGLMLSEAIAAELRSRFTTPDEIICQRTIRRGLLNEAHEALQKLDECDFADASLSTLKEMLIEVQDVYNTSSRAAGSLLALIRQKEMSEVRVRAAERATNGGKR